MKWKSVLPLFLFAILFVCKNDGPNEKFWEWFAQRSADFHAMNDANQEKLFAEMAGQLRTINPGLTFEISPVQEDGNRILVISADGIRTVFPAVRALTTVAPRVPGWKVVAFRQPHPGMEIHYQGVDISPRDVRFTLSPDGEKIDIVLYIPDYRPERAYQTAAFLLLDSEAGEYAVETYLGVIELRPLEKEPSNTKPLSDLRGILKAMER